MLYLSAVLRRTITIVIMLSMTLHCFSRLGVLSYIFEKRHEVAYALGLIAEVPIAMCNSDYDFTPGLVIDQVQDEHPSPQSLSHAQEIILFIHTVRVELNPQSAEPFTKGFDLRHEGKYASPSLSVFHPPSVG